MANIDSAFYVTTYRNGNMTCVQHFLAGEVGRALAYIESARASGAELQVFDIGRQDGLGVSTTDLRKLRRAVK